MRLESVSVCIAGKNDIAVNIAEWINVNFPEVSLYTLINKTDTGEDTWQKSLLKWSKSNNIIPASLSNLYGIEGLYFFSLEFDRIIKPKKFASNHLFNLHFSLLPAYKGMYTSVMPLLNGETVSGVTLHCIDPGIDTGNIIATDTFSIFPDMTARDLYFTYLKYGQQLFQTNFTRIIIGDYQAEPQTAYGSSYYGKSEVDFSAIIIDLKATAWQVHNQIRAFTFREYQLPVVAGQAIYKSTILPTKSTRPSGEIITSSNESIDVATVDYDIRLYITDQGSENEE